MRCSLLPPCPTIRRCPVPDDLRSITRINTDAEIDPRAVGIDPLAVARVWNAAERLYASGMHPALQLCVRHRGRVLIDRAIGFAAGSGPDDSPAGPRTPVTPATPICIFSASKAMTAMLIHLLDQRDLLRLDDPVCEYIPEFARGAKQWITIRHVLIHRAGIPNPPHEMMRLDTLEDPDRIIDVLCDLPQAWRPGRQLAYHAITGGFLLAEIVRRVTGHDVRTFLTDEIRRPLGLRWLNYGVAPEDVGHVAVNAMTGPPPLPPFGWLIDHALGIDLDTVVAMSNDPRFLTAIVPSGNIVATADETSRFYQLLLDGGTLDGVRIFEPRTIRRATVEQSYLEMDFTLVLPFRYSMGFMLGADWFSPYGPNTRHAFGHVGLSNVVAWADPEREVAAALLTTGKPTLYPELYFLWRMLEAIGEACPKVRPPWPAQVTP
ncbi:MAG: serine hydrolase domain-containing protein [Candidatus Binatia bacterium]